MGIICEYWYLYTFNILVTLLYLVIDIYGVGFDTRKVRSIMKNLPSASEKHEVIRDFIGKELRKGSISGPWPREVLPQLITNRFKLIPKSNGKWQMAIDCRSLISGWL